jgi:hypothetical protein
MKDYLPQLLENEQTVSCSHYKRLIRSGGVPLFNISDSVNNKLIDCILGMIYKTLSESVRAALNTLFWMEHNGKEAINVFIF